MKNPDNYQGVQLALLNLTRVIQTYHTDVRSWAEASWASVPFTTKEKRQIECIVALRAAMPKLKEVDTDESILFPRLAILRDQIETDSWVVLFASALLHLPYKCSIEIVCEPNGSDLHVRVQIGWDRLEVRPQEPLISYEPVLTAPINF